MALVNTFALGLLPFIALSPALAASPFDKSYQGRFTSSAHTCVDGQCDDQSDTNTGLFYLGPENAHFYSGKSKGLALPFRQKHVSSEGMTMWIVPTASGFDEVYAKDGFTIRHRYRIGSDRACTVAVSVVEAPAGVRTTYRTAVESCSVTAGNVFAP